MQRSSRLPSLQSQFVLELSGHLRNRRRQVSGGAARPDHGRGAAPVRLERQASSTATPSSSTDGDLQWADVVLTGGMLPQQRDALRIIAAAHAPSKPVVVGGPGCDVEPACVRARRLSGAGRSRRHPGASFWRLGRRSRARRVPGEGLSRRDEVADAALRSDQVRSVSERRHPVFARLSVQLRVLRHHRAVRANAADQDHRRSS